MASEFITPDIVAKTALVSLENNLCMAGLVYRDYSLEYRSVGDTITVRKPATFDVIEFDGDLSDDWQNVTEDSTTITLDKYFTVPIKITAKELSLDVVSFKNQVIDPATSALVQKIDYELCGLYKDIPYYQDTSATTAISDLINARKILNENKTPFDGQRYAVMSPLTTASLLAIDTFHEADKSGSTAGLREASIGKALGFEFFENQNVRTHDCTNADTAAEIDYADGYTAGTSTIHIDSFAADVTLTKGTILTIDSYDYVVTDSVAISSGECDVNIYPALQSDVNDGDAVTVKVCATTSKENLMFHKNAFAMVSAPIQPPIGGATGTTVADRGLSLNVVYDWSSNRQTNYITLSFLCGFKTLYPEMAVRLYDDS